VGMKTVPLGGEWGLIHHCSEEQCTPHGRGSRQVLVSKLSNFVWRDSHWLGSRQLASLPPKTSAVLHEPVAYAGQVMTGETLAETAWAETAVHKHEPSPPCPSSF
jgi:hypothetical protein